MTLQFNIERCIVPIMVVVFCSIIQVCVMAQGSHAMSGLNARMGIGIFDHHEGRLVTASFEFRLAKRISLEPSLGFTRLRRRDYPITPEQLVVHYKYAGGLDLRYYLFFNHRHSLEGIYTALHLGYYRSAVHAQETHYTHYRSYQTENGIGLGCQYYVFNRYSVGATVYFNYVSLTDLFLNPNGSIRLWGKRPGFLLTAAFQLGISF